MNWRDWEKRCARGGRRIKGSGNKLLKGDAVLDDYVVECKFTTKDYYTLTLRDIQYMHLAASQHFKPPLMELWISGKHLRIVRVDEYAYRTDRKSWRIRPEDVGKEIQTPYGLWRVIDGVEDPPAVG